MRLHAEHLAEVVDEFQEEEEAAETIVSDLVKGFLIPRLASQCKRREAQIEEHKFRVAARLATEDAVSSALTALELSPRSASSHNLPQSRYRYHKTDGPSSTPL